MTNMTRSIEMTGFANLQSNLSDIRSLTPPSIKRNDTKSLFTTLTKVPRCNENRMIENILGDFKEVYRLVSREKDYSTIVGIIPPKTGSVPSLQKKKLQLHSPGSYLDKLQNSAIRLKTENKRINDYTMGPEEYELPNESPKCDIKAVLEQMIINIAPITPLPSTPEADRFNDLKKTFKNNNQPILKDRTNLIKNIIKPIIFVKATVPTESMPTGPKETKAPNSPHCDIIKSSPNIASTRILCSECLENNNNNILESINSDSSSNSSFSDSSSSSGSSESESESSSSEDNEAENKQIITKSKVVSPSIKITRNQCTKTANILVPVRSLSESSSDDEERSKIKPKQSNKNFISNADQRSTKTSIKASEIKSLSPSNKFTKIQNMKNDLTRTNLAFKPNSILEKSDSNSVINGIVDSQLANQFSGPKIPQQPIKQYLQNKDGTKRRVNLQNVNSIPNRGPTYRTYPHRGVGQRSKGCSRPTIETSIQSVPNLAIVSNINTSFTQNDTKTTEPTVYGPKVPNIDKNSAEKLYLINKNDNAKPPEEVESHFKSSRLSGSSSSSSSSNSSSSSDSSSSSNNSSSSSGSEEDESPSASAANNNSSDSQNVEDTKIEVFEVKKAILLPENLSNEKLKQYETTSINSNSENCGYLKSITSTVQEEISFPVINTKQIQKIITDNKVHIQKKTCNPKYASISKTLEHQPKNDTLKVSKNISSIRKSIKSAKVKSREFVEDSDSFSDEDDFGKLSAARFRAFTTEKNQKKSASFEFYGSSRTSFTTEIVEATSKPLSAGIIQQSSDCDPNFVAETVTISTIIPEKMNKDTSSSDADSESEPDYITQKNCNKKFKVDSKKKQALPKVFGRMLFRSKNCSHNQSSNNQPSNKNELEISKTETFTLLKDNNLKTKKERTTSSTSTSTSDSLSRTPIKLKIDLKRLRCLETDKKTKTCSKKRSLDYNVDLTQKCDLIDGTKKQEKQVPENDKFSKIPIKKKHSTDHQPERNGLKDHRRIEHQIKSKDHCDQPKQAIKQNNHSKNDLSGAKSNLINSKHQHESTDVQKDLTQDFRSKNLKIDKIKKKKHSESTKCKKPKHENKDNTFDFLFTPDYTKTKDNRYLPSPSSLLKQDDKVLKRTESSKLEVAHNNSFKTPKALENNKLTSANVENSSTLKDNGRNHQGSPSSDNRNKDHQQSSLKNNENSLPRSQLIFKDEGGSRSSSKNPAKMHKREISEVTRHKHRRSEFNSNVNDHRRWPFADHEHKHKLNYYSGNNHKHCNFDHKHNPERSSSNDNSQHSQLSSSFDSKTKEDTTCTSNHLKDKYKKPLRDRSQVDREGKHKTSSDSNRQKESSYNCKGSSFRNKRDDLEERSSLKTCDHKSYTQEERMSNDFVKSVTDRTNKDQRTGSDENESGNQSSLSRSDHKPLKLDETHSLQKSKRGNEERKQNRPFVAPSKTALSGNSHFAGGMTSSESSTDIEKPIKRRKPSANNCSGKRVKISEEQNLGNKELEKADPTVSPISSDWVCDDDESDERPGELFANYATFVQKIEEIEAVDRETLISRGRQLKRAADNDCYHMRQVLLYLDSCLFYMRATALSVPNDRTAASRLSLETLPLISLRCEGILYNHLFKLKQHQCFEVMKEFEDFLDTGKGDLLRENTPPSSSPGREHPFLPSNRLLNTIQRQNAFLQYLTYSQILWEKADKLTANFEDFFHELNVEYGEMSVYKPMTHIYNFTRGAIAKLLKQ